MDRDIRQLLNLLLDNSSKLSEIVVLTDCEGNVLFNATNCVVAIEQVLKGYDVYIPHPSDFN